MKKKKWKVQQGHRATRTRIKKKKREPFLLFSENFSFSTNLKKKKRAIPPYLLPGAHSDPFFFYRLPNGPMTLDTSSPFFL